MNKLVLLIHLYFQIFFVVVKITLTRENAGIEIRIYININSMYIIKINIY